MGSRFLHRRGDGRFRRAPSLEEIGFDVAKAAKECGGCGHRWNPVLVSGRCPQCGGTDGRMLDDYVREGS